LNAAIVLDPDQTTRIASAHAGTPAGILAGGREASPHALQILTTEHWSLLASRSMGYTEAMSRVSIFVAALTGSVVALALVRKRRTSVESSSRSRSCCSRSTIS
jgi:hypothetical protein